jgi:hypothetical protein
VILRQKETYLIWLAIYKDFPKVERYGLGNKIEQAFLDTLEITFALSYMPIEQKIPFLNKAISRLDVVKFFTQLAWEHKLISTDKYSDLISKLEEIGRQLGGWKKGLQTKTPRT